MQYQHIAGPLMPGNCKEFMKLCWIVRWLRGMYDVTGGGSIVLASAWKLREDPKDSHFYNKHRPVYDSNIRTGICIGNIRPVHSSNRSHCSMLSYTLSYVRFRTVFLNRRAAARYRDLASIIPGLERFSWNLSFYFSKRVSWIYSEEENIRECVQKLRPRCWPEEIICYKISLVQWLITNLNVLSYLSTCHTVYISVQIFFMIMI